MSCLLLLGGRSNCQQVLGLAILGVFGVGFLKLLWTNRIVKKQEMVDEEKRTRIQQLRSSGQIVESRKSYEVPFGVRAIQSGIQVDGIWISQTATPIPSELKLGHLQNTSSDMVASADSSKRTTEVPAVRPVSRQSRQQIRDDHTGDGLLANQETSGDRPVSRPSYKPRRSSHLRFGSAGEYDETTLDQLEGRPSPKKIYTHRPRGSRQHNEFEVDSASAADNERSSGASDDSDATLSHERMPRSRHPIVSPYTVSKAEASIARESLVHSGKPVRSSLPLQSSKVEYFSVPSDSPEGETSDPFATPREASPAETPNAYRSTFAPAVAGPSYFDETNSQSSHQKQYPAPFVPGELHVNKTIRKVNSGFEVLPAGTFGAPSEFKGKGVDNSQDEDSGERRQSKLQKKARSSMTGRRASSTADRS